MARQKKRTNDLVAALRPIAKALVKKTLRVYDVTKETVAEAGDQLEGLIGEARAEMKHSKPSKSGKKQKGTHGRAKR